MHFYNLLFDIPIFLAWVLCTVFFLGLSGLIVLIIRRQRSNSTSPRSSALSHTLISGLLVPIGLNMAFMASDVWKENEKGQAATEQEAGAVHDALRVLKHMPEQINADLRARLLAYVNAAVQDEWPRMGHDQVSEQTESALDVLTINAAKTAIEVRDDPYVSSQMALLNTYLKQVREARDNRLNVATYHINMQKWLVLLILLTVCMYVIYDIHYHTRHELRKAIVLISVSFASISFLILVNDRPFTGSSIIEPDHLRQIQKSQLQ